MSSEWIDKRINAIYSHVRSRTISKFKSKYPDIRFTQDDAENIDAIFPTVYMFFDFVERQSTLDGGVINAVYMTIRTQVSVKDDSSQGNNTAREINAKVRDELCGLGFFTSSGAIPTRSGGIKILVANYQRMVGHDDPLII